MLLKTDTGSLTQDASSKLACNRSRREDWLYSFARVNSNWRARCRIWSWSFKARAE